MASDSFAIAELTFGQLNALVKKLGGVKAVKNILSYASDVTVQVVNHIVDGNADPLLPYGLTVVEHKKQGDMKITRDGEDILVNGKKLEFYLSEGQQNGKHIVGHKLRKELADKHVLKPMCWTIYYLIPSSSPKAGRWMRAATLDTSSSGEPFTVTLSVTSTFVTSIVATASGARATTCSTVASLAATLRLCLQVSP